jgi:hypothetical protein
MKKEYKDEFIQFLGNVLKLKTIEPVREQNREMV